MNNKTMLAGLLVACIISCQVLADDPTLTDIAGQVGLAYSGPTQGDQPVFPYRDGIALAQSHHGGTWPILHAPGRQLRARSPP